MKKIYVPSEMEIVELELVDIITDSTDPFGLEEPLL